MVNFCCICSSSVGDRGKTFILSPEEQKVSGSDSSEIHYCAPCLKLLKDKERGAKLLKSLYLSDLENKGIPRIKAEHMADRFYHLLMKG